MIDKRPRTPREAAAFSLFSMAEEGAWSDGALHHYLDRAGLDGRDAALASRLTYGTVAVNPSVIPYGTLMYITSDDGRFVYGYAYAADTGTAMMTGHAFVDLYYETYEESVESAVIPVTVYIIDDAVAAQYQEENDQILERLLADTP